MTLLPDKYLQSASSALGQAAKCSGGSTVRVSCLLSTRARGTKLLDHWARHSIAVITELVLGGWQMGQELVETIPKTKWHDEATQYTSPGSARKHVRCST
jgi:hypothetical protein